MSATSSLASASPRLSAEQVLDRLLSTVDGLENSRDLTVAKLRENFGVEFAERSGRHAFAEPLTSEWWSTIEWDPTDPFGPQLSVTFAPSDPNANPSMAAICQMDVERFASALIGSGFQRETYRAEHNRIIHEQFVRGALNVLVYPRGESDGSSEVAAHACIERVFVR